MFIEILSLSGVYPDCTGRLFSSFTFDPFDLYRFGIASVWLVVTLRVKGFEGLCLVKGAATYLRQSFVNSES
jgi:hypothetical protein